MQKDIKCPDCGTLFGKETVGRDGKRTLSIKHRDLYRTIDDGHVFGPCRGCGRQIDWGAVDDGTGTR